MGPVEILTVAALVIGIVDAFLSIAILNRQHRTEERLTADEIRLAVDESLLAHLGEHREE